MTMAKRSLYIFLGLILVKSITATLECVEKGDDSLSCSFVVSKSRRSEVFLKDCDGKHCVNARITVGDGSQPVESATSLFNQAASKSLEASKVFESALLSTEPDALFEEAIALYNDEINIYYQIEALSDPLLEDQIQFSIAVANANIGEIAAQSLLTTETPMERLRSAQKSFTELLEKPIDGNFLTEQSIYDIKMHWGLTCIRIANILISTYTIEDSSVQDILVDQEQLLLNPDKAQEAIQKALSSVVESNNHAYNLLNDGIKALNEVLESDMDPTVKLSIRSHLAAAFQSLSSAATTLGDTIEASNYLDKALELNRELQSESPKGSIQHQNAVTSIADILYSRADISLQLGKYNLAKAQYREAMLWYKTNRIEAPVQKIGDTMDATLKEYESALEQYSAMFAEGVDSTDGGVHMDEMGEEDYYQRDNGYEGDIHASLGSIYLAKGDLIEAKSHLSQAIILYGLEGEGREQLMADTKLQYATALFQSGEHDESADVYDEAIEILRESNGEGSNPFGGDLASIAATLTAAIREQSKAESGDSRDNPLYDLDSYLDSLTNTTDDGTVEIEDVKDEL